MSGRAPALAPEQPAGDRRVLGDGTALSLSAAVTGLAGLLCWIVAAATLPQDAVGRASAFVSGFILVAGIAQLNAGLGILRWLPRAGARTGLLVGRAYLVVAVAATVAALVFLLLPAGDVVGHGMGGAGALLFVPASVCWALFQLQDYVLAALGRAWWVPMFNGAFGLARVLALPVLGAALGTFGVLVSWIAPTVLFTVFAGVLILVLVRQRTVRAVQAGIPAELPGRREVLSFLGPTYLATIGTAVLYNSVPLLVIGHYGPALGATFFVIWTGLNAADYAVNGFVNSMVLRGSADPAARPSILRLVGKRLAVLVPAGAAAGAVLAPVLLGLFGHAYAEQGTAALRVLLAGLVLRVLVALGVAVRLMAGDGKGAGAIQASSAVLVLLGVLLAPAGAALLGPALGYLLAQCLVLVVVLPGLIRRFRERGGEVVR
ncbi:hypothetical protein [Amycolatopsis nigrescens]|uniref:hypothetical protein n=1 Tax=Amycolatopsis nigrescens TaxID=381445 RepID=UPI00047831B4|nr:hypothetical protein [Amycolatopsis nigrescens]